MKKCNTSFLQFKIGEELFLTEISSIISIVLLSNLSTYSESVTSLNGICNIRGALLRTIDSRKIFKLNNITSENNYVIVLKLTSKNNNSFIGIIVDDVIDILKACENKIKKTKVKSIHKKKRAITGSLSIDTETFSIINLEKLYLSCKNLNIKENS